MNRNIAFTVLFLIILTSCGYKVVNQNYSDKYKFIESNINGDKRIAYLLRNKFKVGNENAPKSIKLNINATKQKNIYEKNIQNVITKYEILIIAKVNFYVLEDNKNVEFSISKSGIYSVSNRHSETVNNEKKTVKNIVTEISDQIQRDLVTKLNDL